MSDVSRESIKAKIAKLMAMGNHDASNEFEAEAALRQASFLMRKHSIELAEVEAASGVSTVYDWVSVNIPADPVNPTSSSVRWFGILGLGIAKFTDCKADWNRIGEFGYCIKFSGDFSDAQYAAWLAKYLRDRVRVESAAFVGTRGEREGFRVAMVARIIARMKAIKAEADAMLRATGTALVVVDKKIALRDKEFGAQRERSSRGSAGSEFSRAAGAAAGDRVNFNRAVSGTRRALGQG